MCFSKEPAQNSLKKEKEKAFVAAVEFPAFTDDMDNRNLTNQIIYLTKNYAWLILYIILQISWTPANNPIWHKLH